MLCVCLVQLTNPANNNTKWFMQFHIDKWPSAPQNTCHVARPDQKSPAKTPSCHLWISYSCVLTHCAYPERCCVNMINICVLLPALTRNSKSFSATECSSRNVNAPTVSEMHNARVKTPSCGDGDVELCTINIDFINALTPYKLLQPTMVWWLVAKWADCYYYEKNAFPFEALRKD